MGDPGWIEEGNGEVKLVMNKAAYLQRHPHAIDLSTADTDGLGLETQQVQLQATYGKTAYGETAPEAKAEEKKGGKAFTHWCVKGRVFKECDVCRGSFSTSVRSMTSTIY